MPDLFTVLITWAGFTLIAFGAIRAYIQANGVSRLDAAGIILGIVLVVTGTAKVVFA